MDNTCQGVILLHKVVPFSTRNLVPNSISVTNMISADSNDVTDDFVDYVTPLIGGELLTYTRLSQNTPAILSKDQA